MSTYYYPEQRVAVVAMGGFFPDASNLDEFWNNILSKKVSIKEVDNSVLDEQVFYRPEVFGKPNKNDKSCTKIAALTNVKDYTLLTKNYRIPPAVAEHMDPNQHTAIYCVDQALKQLKNSLPKERTAVIFGTGAPGHNYDNVARRTFYARVENALRKNPFLASSPQLEEVLGQVSREVLKNNVPITEDSAPGTLQNIIAARIANVFDFWGPAYTVDSACSSTLGAVAASVAGLLRGEFDAVITGGSEVTISEIPFVTFSGINALSPDGSYPFDSRANGFVMGLGGGVLVLKRLYDALRDGDQIISVISGYGQGSDGKGKYIAAPSEEGQSRVIQSACKMAGYSADTIELIEAHGTGTIVGDVVEINALKKAFQSLGVEKQGFCGVGSVKSNIGHLRYASGAPGMIKASLALRNKILPASANIKEVNPKLQLEGSPFYILTDEKPWRETKGHPRRANVSAYGFGGADHHICLEEFRSEFVKKVYPMSTPSEVTTGMNTERGEKSGEEAVFFSGDSFEEVKKSVASFLEIKPEEVLFARSVFINNSIVSSKKDWRIALCAHSMEEVREKWKMVEQFEKEGKLDNTDILELKGIFVGRGSVVTSEKIAWMFPGQASQYPNMLKSIRESYPSIECFYEQVDAIWKARYGYTVTPLVFGMDEELLKKELKNTKNTHPAMFLSNLTLYKLFSESGVKADYMIGHSLGEITALYASGMIDLKAAVHLVGARGFAFDHIPEAGRGQMVSIKADQSRVADIIHTEGFNISIANVNSPDQTVVGGEEGEITRLVEYLSQNNITFTKLNVSHAFHTRITEGAAEEFYKAIAGLQFDSSGTKVMACHLGDCYPQAKEELKAVPSILKDQIVSPVKFVDSVRKLYEEGVRVFVEVGPSQVLTNLVKNILADKEVKVIAANHKKKDSVEAFKRALAELFACGTEISMVPSKEVLGISGVNAESRMPVDSPSLQVETPVIHSSSCTEPQRKESIVYSGVSVGLPGSFKKVFSEDNFKLLFEGRNLIEMLTDDERNSILDLNITRIIKDGETSAIKNISSINEVIQLAGKFGRLDMLNDYLVDEKTLSQMVGTVCAGVAAGYEALRDAGIPLVREYKKTSCGNILPGRLLLPESMREDTGIIYANGFFPIEFIAQEVSKYIAYKFSKKTRKDLINFYESVISKVSDDSTKKLLSDWFTLHYSRLMDHSGETDIYEFNHDFISIISSNANNRLAQFIGAQGPNLYLNAACSSTASAVTIAEDMIRAGRASRMIVIGSDTGTTKNTLPWVGGGFFSMGAATNSADLFEAAVPFDNRRKGMILGSGALGLIVEKEDDVAQRGMKGVCRILGTHTFNCAGHQSRIDKEKYCIELNKFLSKIEKEHQLDRLRIASKTVYSSHETYSPKKGGCSETEKALLESAFGQKYRELKVINTKGMTGHTLAASIEEAVAAKSLQYQQIPPIVNYRDPDPNLEGLNLSQGGAYDFEYVLRTVIAFGGNGSYHLLQKTAQGDERIFNQDVYSKWLQTVTGFQDAKLVNAGRLLVAEENAADGSNVAEKVSRLHEEAVSQAAASKQAGAVVLANSHLDVAHDVLELYSQITKYPKEMLDLAMDLEADLGIDTVKQATIFSMLSEKYGLSEEEGMLLSNYRTIGHVVDMIRERSMEAGKQEVFHGNGFNTERLSTASASVEYDSEILQVISEITKYPVDMLDQDMEMEADLGIDTVKQATILSMLGEKFGIHEDQGASLSGQSTIAGLIDFIKNNATPSHNVEKMAVDTQQSIQQVPEVASAQNKTGKQKDIGSQVLEVISEITKYPVEMLENEMELEADLGIDTIKQATVFSLISERFGIKQKESTDITQYKTIGSIIGMVEEALDDGVEGAHGTGQTKEGYDKAAIEHTGHSDGEWAQGDLCIQLPVFVEEELGAKDYDLKGKKLWVIGDHADTVKKVSAYFDQFSCPIKEFVFEFSDIGTFEERVAGFVKGPVDVIVDCTGIGKHFEYDRLSGSEEEQMLFLSSGARFLFYQKMSQTNPDPALRILCAVSADGCHGYSMEGKQILNPFYGAVSGFYKGLRKEWRNSNIKVVDLGLPNQDLPDEAVLKLVDEVESSSGGYEVGYAGGKRTAFKVGYFDRAQSKKVDLPEMAHFMVTGGGYGIASEMVLGLAKQKSYKFTILGRTKLSENIQELSSLSEDQLEQKKAEIHETLKKSGEKVTPAIVQKQFEKLKNRVQVYKTIEAIKVNGSQVCYIDCDIRDYESVEDAYKKAVGLHGPVHAVVHGAGIERSKLLTQKTFHEFNEVFSVKAKGLCNLYRVLDKKELKLAIGFSSISGRFGNEAQLDYCAANSFINSFIHRFQSQNSQVHTLSIAWSGWKDVGMAWRNEFVKTHSEEMGINLIEPERGTAEFIKVVNNIPHAKEVIISKGISHFVNAGMMAGSLNETPQIDWITKNEGEIEKVFKVLSVKRDPIINNHRLGETPLMPAVGFMEMLAEFHSTGFGRKAQYCFRDIKLYRPLKLFYEKPQEIIMVPKHMGEGDGFEVGFYTYPKIKYGDSGLVHLNSMKINTTLSGYQELERLTGINEEGMISKTLKEAFGVDNGNPGSSIQLGPLFNDAYCIENNVYQFDQRHVVCKVFMSKEQVDNNKYNLDKLLINPAFMDSLFQACGIHSASITGRTYLPWEVEEFSVVKTPKELGCYKLYAELTYEKEDVRMYNVLMANEQGDVCYYIKKVAMRRISL